MKKFLYAVMIILVGAVAPFAQEEMSDSLQQAKMMEFMQLMGPGEEHQFLKSLEGDWTIETKLWMAPNTDPMIISSEATHKMILGDRFLEMKAAGEFMGQQMESVRILGFDRRSGKYFTDGYDSQATFAVSAEGKFKEDKKHLQMYGEDYDAFWDFTQQYYFDVHFVDENTFIWSVTFVDEQMAQGQESFKMVEATATRKK